MTAPTGPGCALLGLALHPALGSSQVHLLTRALGWPSPLRAAAVRREGGGWGRSVRWARPGHRTIDLELYRDKLAALWALEDAGLIRGAVFGETRPLRTAGDAPRRRLTVTVTHLGQACARLRLVCERTTPLPGRGLVGAALLHEAWAHPEAVDLVARTLRWPSPRVMATGTGVGHPRWTRPARRRHLQEGPSAAWDRLVALDWAQHGRPREGAPPARLRSWEVTDRGMAGARLGLLAAQLERQLRARGTGPLPKCDPCVTGGAVPVTRGHTFQGALRLPVSVTPASPAAPGA